VTHTVEELAATVPDGATIALGGAGLQRKPMALVRALATAGRRNLRVVSFLGSLDVEALLVSGCVGELHAAGVSLDGAGLAPRYRIARQTGSPRFVEWSEGLLLRALEAAAAGVPSLPTWMGVGTDLPALNPWLREGSDPFAGTAVMQVRALPIDVALLHVPLVDRRGHAHVPGDLAADGLLARAAGRTLVTCDEIGAAPPEQAALGRIWIDAVAEAPGGAWPCGSHPPYRADLGVASKWAREGADAGLELLTPAPAGVR
jgi:glutaconate CoA-transferase subunit A